MESQPIDIDYRVEVSGWDSEESFFVEKVTLESDAQGERYVHLRHPLRSGLLVFLRLIDSRVNFPTFPIAYIVKDVNPTGNEGISRVALQKLHRHRRGNDDSTSGSTGTAELL